MSKLRKSDVVLEKNINPKIVEQNIDQKNKIETLEVDSISSLLEKNLLESELSQL